MHQNTEANLNPRHVFGVKDLNDNAGNDHLPVGQTDEDEDLHPPSEFRFPLLVILSRAPFEKMHVITSLTQNERSTINRMTCEFWLKFAVFRWKLPRVHI